MNISEYKKNQTIDDLKRLRKSIDTLINVYSNREAMDIETKRNIDDLYDYSKVICRIEVDRELSKQKSEGKKFLSDDEVDKLVDKIIKEESYKK